MGNTLMQVTKELTEVETSVAEIKFIQNGPNDCPKGWIPWRKSCYWVSNTQLNFNDAVKDCDIKNALVAYPRNVSELMLLKTIARETSNTYVYLWLNIRQQGSKWLGGRHEDMTDELTNYWAYGHPVGGRMCAFLHSHKDYHIGFNIHDLGCDNMCNWICVIDV